MRFFLVISIGIVLIYGVCLARFQPLSVHLKEIEVQTNIDGTLITHTVAPFTPLKSVLPEDISKYDVTHLNLNRALVHHDVIVVNTKHEKQKCVSLNNGSLEDLITLKGVGTKTAQAIMKHRLERSFKSIEDVTLVPGIGIKKLDVMRDQLCL